MKPEILEYRNLIGRFATGVAVIIGEEDGAPVGLTVNSLTSVSLDPLLLLFCARNESASAEAILRTGRFSVNILHETQTQASNAFAGHGEISDLPLIREDGFVHLEHATAVFMCEVAEVYPGGDHKIILGNPTRMISREDCAQPLLFFRGQYAALTEQAAC